jgi:hypothetical protein
MSHWISAALVRTAPGRHAVVTTARFGLSSERPAHLSAERSTHERARRRLAAELAVGLWADPEW